MSTSLRVGIPKEIKTGETRVAGLPEHVRRLRAMGVEVVVQRGAGEKSGYADAHYERAGAQLAESLEEVYARADLLWKVKEILPEEFPLVASRHVLFTYLHPAPRPQMVRALGEAACTAIAYEEMTDEAGRRPLLMPMSRLAGAGAIAVAAQFSQSPYGGCGKLLFGTEGAEPMAVTILGGGIAGRAAVRAALAAGTRVTLLDVAPRVLDQLASAFPAATVLRSSEAEIRRRLPETDVLLNCILWMPGDPHLVTREMLGLMRPGSLIVDVAADPNGGIETSVQTTHEDPIRTIDGVLHYGVQNIPALFARTASSALADATWPYLERMLTQGVAATVRECLPLRNGVVLWRGQLIGKPLGEILGREAVSPQDLRLG